MTDFNSRGCTSQWCHPSLLAPRGRAASRTAGVPLWFRVPPVNDSLRSAVLLLAFNRPGPTERVLEAIMKAGVRTLYVAIDGPRPDRPSEAVRCQQVAELVASAPWADNVVVRRREQNLGCRDGVTDGLDWFFDLEAEGVVLEDDCLPGADFLQYCDTLLDRYRNDPDVWMISGDNLLGSWRPRRSDYFFGDGGIWGWATWRRAWEKRDMAMTTWLDPAARARAQDFLGPVGWRLLAPRYADVAAGRLDTWDYQWSWTRASHGALSVIPARNLVANIGFGADATHTIEAHRLAEIPTSRLAGMSPPRTKTFDRGYQTILAMRDDFTPRVLAFARTLARRASLR